MSGDLGYSFNRFQSCSVCDTTEFSGISFNAYSACPFEAGEDPLMV